MNVYKITWTNTFKKPFVNNLQEIGVVPSLLLRTLKPSEGVLSKYVIIALPCRTRSSWRTCGRKYATTTVGWNFRITVTGCEHIPTVLWGRNWSTGSWGMATLPQGNWRPMGAWIVGIGDLSELNTFQPLVVVKEEMMVPDDSCYRCPITVRWAG